MEQAARLEALQAHFRLGTAGIRPGSGGTMEFDPFKLTHYPIALWTSIRYGV